MHLIIHGSILDRDGRLCCRPKGAQPVWGSPSSLCSGHLVLFPGVKQSGLKFTDCTPSSDNVTNYWSCASTSLTLTGLYVIHIGDTTVPCAGCHYCLVTVAPVTVGTGNLCLVLTANSF